MKGPAETSTRSSTTSEQVPAALGDLVVFLHTDEEHRAAVTRRLGRGAANGHRVLEAAANELVARLVGLAILTEITGNATNRRFRYDPYVRLFTG